MKILYCHNQYQQPGGEDVAAQDEIGLLRAHGHIVQEYFLHNDEINQMSKFSAAAKTIWNSRSRREVSALLKDKRFDLLHAMNTFPLISPAIYYAAREFQVPVVQTLANYRLLCPGSYLMRNGKLCTDCMRWPAPIPAVLHKCYRGNLLASAAVASMLTTHRILGTWRKMVHRYCVFTEHGKNVFIEGGLPADRIAIKPNFIDPIPEVGSGTGDFALFVGRLSPEKGIDTLLTAWREIQNPPLLKIVGDGPLRGLAEQAAAENSCIQVLGWKQPSEVQQLMGDATCLMLPSLWFEGMPKVQLEAMAMGTPVLASRIGSMGETVLPGINGELFEPGNAQDLKECVSKFFEDTASRHQLREKTRQDFLAKYTAPRNYDLLMGIYQDAISLANSSTVS